MKYAFWGTPRFAEIILSKLIAADFSPEVLICNPDRPAGRKQVLTPPPTKRLIERLNQASGHKVQIFQPAKPSAADFKKILAGLDLSVIAAYGKIIPAEILSLPKLGAIGVHPSLLPKYRGPTPIQSAILSGDRQTGVTLFLVDDKVDHGPILSQARLDADLGDLDYLSAETKLAELGAELLIKTLPDYLSGRVKPWPQDEKLASATKKFSAADAEINYQHLKSAWEGNASAAAKIFNAIRALNPEPGVWTIVEEPIWNAKPGERVKLLAAELTPSRNLRITKIQIAGKKPKRV